MVFYKIWEWETLIAGVEGDIKYLEEVRLTITQLSEKFKQQMKDATQEVYTEFYKKHPWGEGVIKEILNTK